MILVILTQQWPFHRQEYQQFGHQGFPFIDDIYANLCFVIYSPHLEFIAKRFFIDWFQQAWTQYFVNFYRSSNDSFG